MKLKTKLSILFSLLALIPLILSSYLVFLNQRDVLFKATIEKLVAVADIQEERVNETLVLYLEQVKQVTSRTQLRLSLSRYEQTGDPNELNAIARIISDAARSVSGVTAISVLDLEGSVLASTVSELVGTDYGEEPFFSIGKKTHSLVEVFSDENNILRARLVGPLILEDKVIGVIIMIAVADPLVAITEDHSGLGTTGEVILAKKNQAEDALFLTPLRFDAGGALKRAIPKERTDIPIINAIQGDEDIFIGEQVVDYRGERVLAVTRFIDALEWGLVVKIDRKEALEPLSTFVRTMLVINILSVLLIITIALLVSKAVITPIRNLTLFAQNLESGNFSMRTEVTSTDEIGFLARTLNNMAGKLNDLYKSLEEKVTERTKELQEANAKNEAMLASIGDGLVFVGLDKKVVLVNRAAQTLLGRSSKELLGHNWFSFVEVRDENKEKVREADLPLTKALGNKETSFSPSLQPYFYTRKDGSLFPVSIVASPVVVSSEMLGVVIVFRDITYEQEVDKAKTEFVSLASHQLRTPLSTINWYAEMLLAGDAGKLNVEQIQYLQEIYRGNQRMVDLVNALLDVSRIELGTFSVEPEELDLEELAEEVIKEQRPAVEKREINLSVEMTPLPLVSVDPKLIRMVFQNLLSNAVKYTPEGGNVWFTLEEKKKGQDVTDRKVTEDSILLTVSDSGLGIPEYQQDKLFQKLFRADNVRETDTEGTGLGLYIVKAIVDLAKGAIWFTSEEKKGTAFYVLIPLEGMEEKTGKKKLES